MHIQITKSYACIYPSLSSNLAKTLVFLHTLFRVYFHRSLYRFTCLMNILHIYLQQKCFIPRNLAWRQRQMRGFSGSQVTRWVVMVMSLRGVSCSCRRIFFTQYRRETVRYKSGLNCWVTRGYCRNRRRVKRALCHRKISCCDKWKIHRFRYLIIKCTKKWELTLQISNYHLLTFSRCLRVLYNTR